MRKQALHFLAASALASGLLAAASSAFTDGEPLLAQTQQKQPLLAKDLASLSGALGLNICYLVELKVPYKTAALSATSTLSALVRDVYGDQVQGIPSNVKDRKELVKWLSLDIQLRAVKTCSQSLPKEIVRDAKRIRSELQQLNKR